WPLKLSPCFLAFVVFCFTFRHPQIMRLFLVAALLLSWQSAPVSNDGIGEQNASRETSQGQQKVSSGAPVVSVSECMGCFQEGAPAHQQENANLYDPRNDRLYRWYLRATVVGVVGGF